MAERRDADVAGGTLHPGHHTKDPTTMSHTARAWTAAALLAATAAVAPHPAAAAAEVVPAITSVDVVPSSAGPFDRMRVNLELTVGATAQPGDQVRLTFPRQLTPTGPGIDIVDDSGATVATAATSANTATFTFTPYVSAHPGFSGAAVVDAVWNRKEVQPGATVALTFEAGGQRFDETATVGDELPNRNWIDVWQGWSDERREDTGGPTDALRWIVSAPRTASSGTVSFSAAPEAGSEINCDRVTLTESTTLDAFHEITGATPVPAARQTLTCRPDRVEATVTDVAAGTWVTLNGRSTVADPSRTEYVFGAATTAGGVGSLGRSVTAHSRPTSPTTTTFPAVEVPAPTTAPVPWSPSPPTSSAPTIADGTDTGAGFQPRALLVFPAAAVLAAVALWVRRRTTR